MQRTRMQATVTVFPVFHRVSYDITVRFDAFEGDTPERMRETAAQTFRFIGYDVKAHETITITEAN